MTRAYPLSQFNYLGVVDATGTYNPAQTSGSANLYINKAGTGYNSNVNGSSNGLLRWQLCLGDPTPESGSNAGSNFVVQGFNDAGNVSGQPLTINRATGIVSLGVAVQIIANGANPYTGTFSTGSANVAINKLGSGNNSNVDGYSNGILRWQMILGNSTAESGSNTGSDFAIQAFNDAGVSSGIPITIARSNLYMTVPSKIFVSPQGTTNYSVTQNPNAADIFLNKNGSGSQSAVTATNQGILRWQISMGDNSTESGSNAGSNFQITNFSDTGTVLGNPMIINRATGITTHSVASVVNAVGASSYSGTFGTGSANFAVNKLGSGNNANVEGMSNGLLRWQLCLGDVVSETGSNAGSNFSLNSFSDAGALISQPITIARNTGYLTLSSKIFVSPAGVANYSYTQNPNCADIFLNKNGTGTQSAVTGTNNGILRWQITLGGFDAETGTGNAGSNFALSCFNDTGTVIANPITIARGTGVTTFSSAIVNGPSDMRMKENITPIEGALAKVNALQGVRYNMIGKKELEIGLIAQDVKPIVPEIIQAYVQPDKPEMMALDYPKLTALLIEAVKELTARIAVLEGPKRAER
jgi:hypothetical protein